MKMGKLLWIFVVIILIVIVIFGVRMIKKGGSDTSAFGKESKTCVQLNGYECGGDQGCEGSWLDASDSFSCCSVACEGGEVLDIEPFEPMPENEDLGDVS